MLRSAERRKRVSQRARSHRQLDFATREVFEPSKEFPEEGGLRDSEDMRMPQLLVLPKIVGFAGSKVSLESQSPNLAPQAANPSPGSASDSGKRPSELYARAASLCEDSAHRVYSSRKQLKEILGENCRA